MNDAFRMDQSDNLERELEYASRLQRASMPEALPGVPGYHFALHYQPHGPLGGDFYDFALSKRSLRVLLADVSGHGVGPALCTMLVKSVFHDAVETNDSTVGILTTMDDRLHRVLPGGMFVAAGILNIDLVCGSVDIGNAGLPYPYVIKGRAREVVRVRAAGRPLGLFIGPDRARDTAARVQLDEGDVLLLATDGLEAALGSPELPDEEALEALLPHGAADAFDVVRQLAASVASARRGSMTDDLSLIAANKVSADRFRRIRT